MKFSVDQQVRVDKKLRLSHVTVVFRLGAPYVTLAKAKNL